MENVNISLIIPLIIGGGFLFLSYLLCRNNKYNFNHTKGTLPPEILNRKINAVERFILFLERSRPMRVYQRTPGNIKTATNAHIFYRQTIDQEFFHNIVQQAYISDETWIAIKQTKQMLEQIADDVVKKIPPDSDVPTFFKTVEQLYESLDDPFIENTISLLKNELNNYGYNIT